MKALLFISLLGIIWSAEASFLNPSTYAVLVAGSNGWWNYRHQADICHAYHVLLNQGLNPDRIIVMMYDDIANDKENDHKGQIFNKPGGPDVYKGVKIDYRGLDVNVENFKNILLGNKDAVKGIGTGRVLESGPNDNVFVNFVDHGGNHILVFPSDCLGATEFIETLKEMKKKQKYGQMVLYIEACEAGSMFENLLSSDDNILVSTASGPSESSFACYCDNYSTCLGDYYSVTWMERMDKLNHSETLLEQYEAVRDAVQGNSHPQLYGDLRFENETFNSHNELTSIIAEGERVESGHGIDSRDAPIHYAKKALERALDPKIREEKKIQLERMIKAREAADDLIHQIFKHITRGDKEMEYDLTANRHTLNKDMLDCYNSIIASFDSNCYNIAKNNYFLKHLYKFANICAKGYNANLATEVIQTICSQMNSGFELIV